MTGQRTPEQQPTGERLDRAKMLLHEALDLDGDRASAWVREQASDDPSLCDYVLKLLSSAGPEAASFREIHETASDYVASLRPEQIGRYRIIDTLGEGGMGTVYLAEQTDPVQREVALKLVKLGMDSRAVVARFEHERQSLAVMEHDGIAKVHDCGTTESGQPFFVMELVRGTPISDYCEDNRLAIPDRIRLMQQVCDAVQHAHQKGVVHRDLKPSNVLVVEVDGKIQVKVIDFGLAKAMRSDPTEAALLTEAGQIVGTLEYMAPEQADPNNADIDTRADVYSLGVMLYELLAGSLPFAGTQLRGIGLVEVQHVMRTVEPPRPSRRLSSITTAELQQVADRRDSPTSSLLRMLRTDLDWVVMRAMAKDRRERYESASALAGDLQRYLDHEPLVAGPPRVTYRFRKFLRRYRSHAIAAATVFLTALTGAVVAIDFAFEAHSLAKEKGELANAEAAAKVEATTNAELFANKVREFDLLSGVVLHERCLERIGELQPPWPVRRANMQQWLARDVQVLVDMLPDIEATVESLRRHAVPRGPEEIEEARRLHERFADVEKLRGWVDADSKAAAVRAGEDLILPAVPEALAKQSAEQLWRMAVARIAPQFEGRSVFYEIEMGLALAQLAVARSEGKPSWSSANDLLAWAYFANGDDERAVVTADLSVELATEQTREESEQRRSQLLTAIKVAPDEHARRLAELETLLAEVDATSPREFEMPSQRFLHDALWQLRADIEELRQNEVRVIKHRLQWSDKIGELSRAHPKAQVTWHQARAAIATADDVVASSRYLGQAIALEDERCVGLVPIGMNPATRLWEFYHLASAWDGVSDPGDLAIPTHHSDGSIDLDDDTGIVFVLVPGGEFVMGAQSEDASAANYDAEAQWYVGPPHTVRLEPFFLARHELTQAQWARLWQGDEAERWPSKYRAGVTLKSVGETITAVNPVDQVDWLRSRELLHGYGLRLPTEAQWEYACRAGTSTPFFCASSDVQHFGNLADAKARRNNAEWDAFEAWDDGFVVTAPVGSMRPNPWGFHDVIGNVFEWCEDGLGDYQWGLGKGDGLREERQKIERVIRGGSIINRATFGRSSMRTPAAKTTRLGHVGVRAMRSLQPLLIR